MLRRSISRQSSISVRFLPTGLRALINENALSLSEKVPYSPIKNILNSDEHVLLKTVDQDSKQCQLVELSSLLDEKQTLGTFSKVCDHVCIVGSKGCGKTTVLTNFIKQALQGNIPQIDPNEDIVHVINCHDMDPNKKMSVADFLFGGMKDNVEHEDLRAGFEWMCANPTMLTFVIDSLDTLPFKVQSGHLIGLPDHATPSSILLSLLEGNLFLGCGVVSSCVENTLQDDGERLLRVEKFASVCGFSPSTISKIALSYLGKEIYYRYFVHFKNSSPYLLSQCEHPNILILTLLSLRYKKEDSFLPKGLSGVVLLMLVRFIEESQVVDEKITRIVNILKHVSYLATHKGKTTFETKLSEADLKRLSYPSDNIDMFKKVGDEEFECLHPVLLHTLAALYIAEMDFEEFELKLPEMFDNSSYKSALRYLPGFLFNDQLFETTLKFYKPESPKFIELKNNRQRKCELLKDSIQKELIEIDDKWELLEQFDVLHMINESAGELKEVVFKHFDKFSIPSYGSETLNSADMCSLATCICWKVEFQYLEMTDCYLPTYLIETFYKCMMTINSRATINVLRMNYKDGKRTGSEDDAITLSHFFVHVMEQCDFRGWYFKGEYESCLQAKLDTLQSFRLTVNINKDDILTAQSTWSDTLEKTISPNGGYLKMNDCSLDFPKGCLEETDKVKMEMINFTPINPEDYIVISPCINVVCKSGIRKPVMVEVQPWYFSNDEKLKKFNVEILHLEDGDDNWGTIKTLSMNDEKPLQFECRTFSFVTAAIKKVYEKFLRFPMTGFLYAKDDSFSVSFFPYHASTIKETTDKHEAEGYARACPFEFNIIDAKMKDKIEFDATVEKPKAFSFDIKGEKRPALKIDHIVKGRRCHNFLFCLNNTGCGRGTHAIKIHFSFLLNGKVESQGAFTYKYSTSGKGRSERIEDVFQKEIARFANYSEFRKFAMSGKGLKLNLPLVTEIEDDYQQSFKKKEQMFSYWVQREGKKATPDKFRSLLENYFTEAPYTSKDEQAHLESTFDDAISSTWSYSQWFEFAVAEKGLQIPMSDVLDVIGGQESMTRTQKKEVLDKWRENQGNKATPRLLFDLFDEYFVKTQRNLLCQNESTHPPDAFDKVMNRFDTYQKWFDFAVSDSGLQMCMKDVFDIIGAQEYITRVQKRKMLEQWLKSEDVKATPEVFKKLIDGYFSKYDSKPLEDVFDEVINRIGSYREWFAFSVFNKGLRISVKDVLFIMGGQQNITKAQRKNILEKWKENQGDSASSQLFKQISDRYQSSVS